MVDLAKRVGVTRFLTVYDRVGERVELDLREWVRSPVVHVGSKKALPAVSFARFEGLRSLHSVAGVSCVGIDIDESISRETLGGTLKSIGALVHVHSSISSTPSAMRWRVIFPLDREATRQEHDSIFQVLRLALSGGGVEVDSGCRDASRLFYVPARRPDGPFRGGTVEGDRLDVRMMLDIAKSKNLVPSEEPPIAPVIPLYPRDALFTRALAYARATPPAIQRQGGDRATFILAGKLVQGFGLGDDDALTILREWNTRCSPPWNDRDLMRKVYLARERGTLERGFLAKGEGSK